jgi:hypothetical protein
MVLCKTQRKYWQKEEYHRFQPGQKEEEEVVKEEETRRTRSTRTRTRRSRRSRRTRRRGRGRGRENPTCRETSFEIIVPVFRRSVATKSARNSNETSLVLMKFSLFFFS